MEVEGQVFDEDAWREGVAVRLMETEWKKRGERQKRMRIKDTTMVVAVCLKGNQRNEPGGQMAGGKEDLPLREGDTCGFSQTGSVPGGVKCQR